MTTRTESTKRLAIASRGSKLALTQAHMVSDFITSHDASFEIEIRVVKTRGDEDKRAFGEIGDKGLFVKEVEREVIEGHADLAVHSAKDLTADLGEGCVIASVPRRGPVHDVVVGGEGAAGEQRLAALPPNTQVGTSSMRRRALLAEARPDLDVVDLRGNLDTRLDKVARGEVQAAVLAAAGIARLGHPPEEFGRLDPSRWVPAPAQGALAIEALAEREELLALLASFSDQDSFAAIACERAFAAHLEGGCSVPLGCWAEVQNGALAASGFLGLPDGSESLRDRISGSTTEAESLGRELAEAILGAGGGDILDEIRASEVTQPSAP
jgi:hydroxymethylbilane synthase